MNRSQSIEARETQLCRRTTSPRREHAGRSGRDKDSCSCVLYTQVQVQGPTNLLPAAGCGGVRCTNIFRPLHAEDVGAASHHTYSVAFRLRAVGTRGRFPQSHAVSPAETRSEYTSSMRAGRVNRTCCTQ